jgi:hypothetical protein
MFSTILRKTDQSVENDIEGIMELKKIGCEVY